MAYDQQVLSLLVQLAQKEEVFFKTTVVLTDNPEKVFEKFRSECKYIEAAGGVVFNRNGEMLMIFRNGKWDLPKGKLEKGEVPETGSVREVEEECGVNDLTIGKPLSSSWHTYEHHGNHVLKRTYWFVMQTTFSGDLIPQTEEGITEVKWMKPDEVEDALNNTYGTIVDVIREAIGRPV